MAEKVCGVYFIKNTVNGKCYVGSSVDIKKRWGTHKLALRNGSHHSKHLQRAWDKYGESAFEFGFCELCSTASSLTNVEQQWLDRIGHYNVSRKADRPRPPEMTPEIRQRISAALKGRVGTMKGKKHTEHARARMSEERKGAVRSHAFISSVSRGKLGKSLSEQHKDKLRKPKSEDAKFKFKIASAFRWMEPGHLPKAAEKMLKDHPVEMLDFALCKLNARIKDINRPLK
jgi:group I intron endonuclease